MVEAIHRALMLTDSKVISGIHRDTALPSKLTPNTTETVKERFLGSRRYQSEGV